MGTAEVIYELVKTLPEEQAGLVLVFTQFVRQQGDFSLRVPMPAGTLTGLRGIAKSSGEVLSDEAVADDYADYLFEKYQ